MTDLVRFRKHVLLVIVGWAVAMIILSGIAHYIDNYYPLGATICVAQRGVQGMVCTVQ
jgi:hypothetical protein